MSCIKLDFKEVKRRFEEADYILLSTSDEYVNSHNKLKYKCPEGHINSMHTANFSSGRRCPQCARIKMGLKKRISIDYVKEQFEKEDYILLSTTSKLSREPLYFICPSGHEGRTRWNHWQQGHRCNRCDKEFKVGPNSPSWRGGIGNAPYCDAWADKEYKEDIKKRDNYRCQNPYCYGTTELLVVHHIDYTKTICGPDNLITVCNGCNTRANYSREWHTAWYRTIMNKKYGYIYED